MISCCPELKWRPFLLLSLFCPLFFQRGVNSQLHCCSCCCHVYRQSTENLYQTRVSFHCFLNKYLEVNSLSEYPVMRELTTNCWFSALMGPSPSFAVEKAQIFDTGKKMCLEDSIGVNCRLSVIQLILSNVVTSRATWLVGFSKMFHLSSKKILQLQRLFWLMHMSYNNDMAQEISATLQGRSSFFD